MAATNETIADIIAEMLGARTEFPFVYLMGEPDTPEVIDPKTKRIIEPRKINIRRVTVKELADRLKAARKRERGDAAKLREAIEDLFAKGCVSRHDRVAVCPPCIDNEGYSPSNEWCARCSSDVKEKCMAIYNACAALAAPPRNCDVAKVTEDPWRAWLDDKTNWNEDGNPKLEIHDWLLAPATEKEGGNDGNE